MNITFFKVKMRKFAVIILAVLACSINVWSLAVTDKQVSAVLKRLDAELTQREKYIDARQSRIDSLHTLYALDLEGDSAWLASTMRLADEYTAFNTDSALYYYSKGYDRAATERHDSIALAFKLQRATYLPLVGFMQDAVNEYESINPDMVPGGLQELYFDAGRQMYSYIAAFYINYPQVYAWWSGKSLDKQLQLIELLENKSPKYKLNMGEYYFSRHEYSKARATLMELLTLVPEESNMYARAAHKIAEIALARGEHNEYVYYLTLSAIADIKSATLEVMSLQELGELLFRQGQVERAHNYLSIALANAVKCHAMMRMLQSSEAMPIIESAHKVELEAWENRMYAFMGGLALMLVLLVVLLMFLRREMRRMKLLQQHLEEANHTKEVYISQFLNLCSIYMDKLQQFSKLVNRKISAGNVDDLYKITKSGKFVEEQSKDFYEVFDNAFLHIYPTFVESVNKLLRPGEQINLQEGELLNTDLRLLAFMRLGIEESTRIAQILNYSVNTVYAYRNKLKNRAINRETFEADVMKISSVS